MFVCMYVLVMVILGWERCLSTSFRLVPCGVSNHFLNISKYFNSCIVPIHLK